jgi:hypothetical protein
MKCQNRAKYPFYGHLRKKKYFGPVALTLALAMLVGHFDTFEKCFLPFLANIKFQSGWSLEVRSILPLDLRSTTTLTT